MVKKSTKRLFFSIVFTLLAFGQAFAQTITIGNVDPGPYAPGSSISVPIVVSGQCVTTKTTYNLYLSNSSGSFAAQTLIGSFSNFYTTFVNGKIPAGAVAGTGYVVKVVASNPTVVSTISAPFPIVAGTAVVAAVASDLAINPTYPEVLGTCSGTNNTPYNFSDQSTAGSTVTASFFNELSQKSEGTITPTATGTNFTAKAAHYTVFVKAVNNGIVGTASYFLVNNVVNTSFEVNGPSTICLGNNGAGSLTYGVDNTKIVNNFPGLIYTIKWGDSKSSVLTLCDIVSGNFAISHTYQESSCGNNPNGQTSAFEVDILLSSVYCGNSTVGTPVTSYANVFTPPDNTFNAPLAACTNTQVTFVNTSNPGQDQNSGAFGCQNQNARYDWIVDGITVGRRYTLTQNFDYTFTTPGVHSVTLHFNNPLTQTCAPADLTKTICIQNPPQPKFTLPVTGGCAPLTVTPTNSSVIDANCNAQNKYEWAVSGPANVSYANGTNANSAQPQFVFATAGVYQISLGITTISCGTITAAPQTIVVDSPTQISLSPDVTICGTNQTFTFDPSGGTTQTSISGVAQPQANTYTWSVSGGPYSFANGTTANSQYPQLTFTGYAAYKVSVTVQDRCATVTKSQNLTFQQVPVLTVTPSSTSICPGSTVNLKGTITGTYASFQWLGGNGATGFSPANSLTATYTPTAAEISAGSATLILDVKTNLSGPCADVQQSVTINIFPVNTITSAAAWQICSANPANYSISSTAPGSTFSWTAGLTSGVATGFKNGNGPAIADVLNNTTTNDAVVTYTITPQANGCPGVPFKVAVTVKPLPAVTATAVNALICSGNTATVNLNPTITGTTFTWTSTTTGSITGNSQQSAAISATAINDVLINNGLASATVKYAITPFNGACPGTPVVVTITVEPVPIISKAGADNEVCNLTSYTLSGNSPSPGTGLWTVSPAGPHFDDATKSNATAIGLVPGNAYTFTWTITPPAPCPSNSSSVNITDDAPSVGGTTSGSATVCSTGNGGTITLTGQVGSILRWESSTDNFATGPNLIPNNTTSLQYNNLPATTQYRAVVQNSVCSIQFSTVAVITVNQPAIQAIAGGNQNLCGSTAVTLQGNNPSPFTGVWTQTAGPAANISSPNSAQTPVTGLVPGNDYTFLWTIKGQPPCTDNSDSVKIHDANDVVTSFKADKTDGCGDLTVSLTNTSTVLAGVKFLWEFGDGVIDSTDVSPSHLFAARTDGKDTTYTISLFVVNNCNQRPPSTLTITVRPQTPVAYIAPSQITGCAPFTLSVQNLSPGNNKTYTYYLYDGSTLINSIVKTDKSQVTFPAITTVNTTQYTLYMVATGFCGNTGQSAIIPITTSPTNVVAQMFIENGANKGCAPLNATFINNSTGGDSYKYTIYDTNHNVIDIRQGGTAPLPYTFDTPGIFYVTITTVNSCTNLESQPSEVDVYTVPQPRFTADDTLGCKNLTVTFTNQTPDDPTIHATSLIYDWDFGDNSHATGFSPGPHTYFTKGSPFTVTLTATNPITNCINVISKNAYITVTPPPSAAFSENPDSVASIPDYSFSFIDQTTNGPVSWLWDFGDKSQGSTSEDPVHIFPDTGIYKVTLTTGNVSGCDSVISHYVRITGVPGQLFLPNAFEPDGGITELKTFMAKGSGIKEWHLQIFNNFSQLMWETSKLDDKGVPVEGWDGTFNGVRMPQGVYIWQASATFINGTEWKGNVIHNSLPKRVGTIHLIR